jgi:hypothetical protein
MKKLRRLVYLPLFEALGTLAVLLLSEYILIAIFGILALLSVAR